MPLDSRRPDSLKERLRTQLDQALKAGARTDDHSVHQVRRQLKRARATLRLMRAAIGDTHYRGANNRLRDAASPLRSPRDAAALLKTLEKIATPRDKKAMKSLAGEFRQHLQHAHGSAQTAYDIVAWMRRASVE